MSDVRCVMAQSQITHHSSSIRLFPLPSLVRPEHARPLRELREVHQRPRTRHVVTPRLDGGAVAEARRLESLLQYTSIKAPFEGVVTRRLVNRGDLVQAANTSRTTPLLTVTGSIAARLGPGADSPEARWDFVTPELASAYRDRSARRPGMILAGAQLLQRNRKPTRQEIAHALEGNLCRCTGYSHIIDAIEYAAKKMAKKKR